MSTNVAERRVASSRPLFLDLRKKPNPKRWGAFAASYSVQAIALLALLAYTVLAPRIETAPVKSVGPGGSGFECRAKSTCQGNAAGQA